MPICRLNIVCCYPPQQAHALQFAHLALCRLGRKRVEEVALYYITASWEDIKGSLKSPVVQLRPETR